MLIVVSSTIALTLVSRRMTMSFISTFIAYLSRSEVRSNILNGFSVASSDLLLNRENKAYCAAAHAEAPVLFHAGNLVE
jgi:hypothetical protein